MKTQSFSRFSIPAVLVVAALALTGCSGGGDKKADAQEGPLQKYMSAMWDGEEFTQDDLDKQQVKIEELVAKCMAKEAFEYTPNAQNGGRVFTSSEDDDGPEWGSLKFAETYGYGMVDWPGKEEMENQGNSGEDYVDPNQKYVESLSESEQQAYQEALWGPPQEESEVNEDGSYEYDWKTAGCQGAAQNEVQPQGQSYYDDPEFEELNQKMQEVWSEAYGDGENPSTNEDIVKLDRKWAECITEAGYDYTSTVQPQNELREEWNEKQNAGFNEETGEYKEPTKDEQKKLKEDEKVFKAKEIKIAVADKKCQEKVNYTEEQFKASSKIEQKFLDENKAELDAMIAKYGTKKKDK